MTRMFHRLAPRLRADRRGLTTLEFGFVGLPLVLVLFGIVEIGMAVRVKSALQYATTQTARCLVVNATLCNTTQAAQAYAVTQTMGAPISASAFTISTAVCGRQVVASAPFPVIAHRVLPGVITLTARSCYPT